MNETLKRSISGTIYVLLLLTSIYFSTDTFFLLFGLFLLISVYEFSNLVHINNIVPIFLSGALYLFTYKIANSTNSNLFLFSLKHNQTKDLVLLIATLAVSIKCIFFLFNNKITSLSTFSKYVYLFGYVLFPFIIITKIPFGINGYNPKIIIGIFVLIWTNDTFAYIVGKSIGKRKLLERISPKKTIEGFFGGLSFSIVAGYLIAEYYIEGATVIWIVISVIVGIFGTIGDLIESKFKRIAGVKDSGKIMPGHGGVLDRLDSVIFVAPLLFLYYQILYYVS